MQFEVTSRSVTSLEVRRVPVRLTLESGLASLRTLGDALSHGRTFGPHHHVITTTEDLRDNELARSIAHAAASLRQVARDRDAFAAKAEAAAALVHADRAAALGSEERARKLALEAEELRGRVRSEVAENVRLRAELQEAATRERRLAASVLVAQRAASKREKVAPVVGRGGAVAEQAPRGGGNGGSAIVSGGGGGVAEYWKLRASSQERIVDHLKAIVTAQRRMLRSRRDRGGLRDAGASLSSSSSGSERPRHRRRRQGDDTSGGGGGAVYGRRRSGKGGGDDDDDDDDGEEEEEEEEEEENDDAAGDNRGDFDNDEDDEADDGSSGGDRRGSAAGGHRERSSGRGRDHRNSKDREGDREGDRDKDRGGEEREKGDGSRGTRSLHSRNHGRGQVQSDEVDRRLRVGTALPVRLGAEPRSSGTATSGGSSGWYDRGQGGHLCPLTRLRR